MKPKRLNEDPGQWLKDKTSNLKDYLKDLYTSDNPLADKAKSAFTNAARMAPSAALATAAVLAGGGLLAPVFGVGAVAAGIWGLKKAGDKFQMNRNADRLAEELAPALGAEPRELKEMVRGILSNAGKIGAEALIDRLDVVVNPPQEPRTVSQKAVNEVRETTEPVIQRDAARLAADREVLPGPPARPRLAERQRALVNRLREGPHKIREEKEWELKEEERQIDEDIAELNKKTDEVLKARRETDEAASKVGDIERREAMMANRAKKMSALEQFESELTKATKAPEDIKERLNKLEKAIGENPSEEELSKQFNEMKERLEKQEAELAEFVEKNVELKEKAIKAIELQEAQKREEAAKQALKNLEEQEKRFENLERRLEDLVKKGLGN